MSKKDSVSRRDFVRSTALLAAALAAPSKVFALAQAPLSTGGASPVRLGLASYTFRNFNRAQLIEGVDALVRSRRAAVKASPPY